MMGHDARGGDRGGMNARLTGYAGAVIGFLGWLVGLAGLCFATNHADLLWRVLPAGLLVSLGMALVTIMFLEGVARLFGRTVIVPLSAGGIITLDAGSLWLLLNHWLMPQIAARPDLAAALERLGVGTTADAWPIALLAAGNVLLLGAAFAAARAGRAGPG